MLGGTTEHKKTSQNALQGMFWCAVVPSRTKITYGNIQEEELKNKVARDYFADYDSTQIIGKIDFCIAVPQDESELFETESLLWAEAKTSTKKDIYESFVQLILTIGRARTFDSYLPLAFLGAFDAEKIAFLPYTNIIDVFYQNDFNWNVTPSDHETKEFKQLYKQVKADIEREVLLYHFGTDDKELHKFIRSNFIVGKSRLSKIRINKNNFTHIYLKWAKEVKPTIAVDWQTAKKEGLVDADFYLADILSEHNISLREKLFVLLRNDRYVYNIQRKSIGSMSFETVEFNDNQVAHTQFWNRYNRPPRREYWDYIVERRDLLVPQDVRERKGSYFTPRKWVELSQQYIAAELGEDWQDEYYVWDCAAGTGNLLAGLINKYNIWASTLDAQDVKAMHDLINNNCLNLLEKHVFQFDFLNDRDQFLYPNDGWTTDKELQSDCLAYTLFNNNIQSRQGTNHWIPFTEQEVDAKEKFESHFMTDYIQGKNLSETQSTLDLFNQSEKNVTAQILRFSPEAQAVMDAGHELWRYYHAQPDADPNAALYDIRLHFQGTNAKGKMNTDSDDSNYMELITDLRQKLKLLARKIEPKVYEYGFLLQ